MQLDSTIGKRLKTTLESIQPYPVIIADRKGMIVAATDAQRVGHVRKKVLKVIDAWPGKPEEPEPGVRCITYNGVVVGTIELLKIPPEDEPYLVMASTVVELLLEKEYRTVRGDDINKPLHQLLTALVGVHPLDCSQMQRDLTRNGFNVSTPRTTVLLQFSPVEKKAFSHAVREIIVDDRQLSYTVQQMLDQLKMFFSDSEDYILPNPNKRSALVLCADRSATLDMNTISIFKTCQRISQECTQGQLVKVYAVIGNRCCCIKDYERQYEQLEMRLSAGRLLRSDQEVFLGSSVVLGSIVLYSGLENRKRITKFIFGKLLASKQREVLLDTLDCYFDSDMSIARTAEKLFIHRNTLLQRLHRIEELTGFSLNSADGFVTLRLGLLHYRSLIVSGDLQDILPD